MKLRHVMGVILAIIMVLALVPGAIAEPGASMTIIDDRLADMDGDGITDYLALDISLYLPSDASYQVMGIIKNSGGIKAMEIVHSSGSVNITLLFNARDIYNAGLEGKLDIMVFLFRSSDILLKTTYTTHEYTRNDFNPAIIHGHESENVNLHLESSGVRIESRNMSVFVKSTYPEILYYYTSDPQDVFIVNFTGVTFYNDTNANGRYDSGEEVLYADMTAGIWSLKLGLIEGYSNFDFSIIGAFSTSMGEFEIEFRYSRGMNTVNSFERQKFDIYIHSYGISARRVVLWHTVSATGKAMVGSLERNGDSYYVRHYNDKGEILGFYAFSTKAKLYTGDGEEENINVTGYTNSGVIAMDYPLKAGFSIHHDPEVALDPGMAPRIVKRAIEIIRNNPVIFGISMTITSVVVAGSIYNYRKKRGF